MISVCSTLEVTHNTDQLWVGNVARVLSKFSIRCLLTCKKKWGNNIYCTLLRSRRRFLRGLSSACTLALSAASWRTWQPSMVLRCWEHEDILDHKLCCHSWIFCRSLLTLGSTCHSKDTSSMFRLLRCNSSLPSFAHFTVLCGV